MLTVRGVSKNADITFLPLFFFHAVSIATRYPFIAFRECRTRTARGIILLPAKRVPIESEPLISGDSSLYLPPLPAINVGVTMRHALTAV